MIGHIRCFDYHFRATAGIDRSNVIHFCIQQRKIIVCISTRTRITTFTASRYRYCQYDNWDDYSFYSFKFLIDKKTFSSKNFALSNKSSLVSFQYPLRSDSRVLRIISITPQNKFGKRYYQPKFHLFKPKSLSFANEIHCSSTKRQ